MECSKDASPDLHQVLMSCIGPSILELRPSLLWEVDVDTCYMHLQQLAHARAVVPTSTLECSEKVNG